MCTNITLKSTQDHFLMARTMDFSFELDPEMILIPRHVPLHFAFLDNEVTNHFAYFGLAKNIGSYALADGVNEYGLAAAALYFEGFAHYEHDAIVNQSLAPHEVVMWALAHCKTVEDVRLMFARHPITHHVIEFLGIVPPLHWVFQDATGASIIVEPTPQGIQIYTNQIGVLTNSPDYPWHLTNIRNYIGLDPGHVEARTLYGQEFKPFGQGSGTFGIPGDLTPPSRFIKALYSKLSAQKPESDHELIITAQHILNGVDIAKGNVITQRKTIDYTQYMSFMIPSSQTYAYRTYDSFNTYSYCLHDYNLNQSEFIKI
ncbi:MULTISPECIES: linear amide C-N hydrolase [unclassified Erysipelothrix]|uniref:linear amide C-N hydrolase n=1 Tax=unclassified Erysipelothrix TaxID=2624170 RepID=UPI001377B615|nr:MULTISPECIES: choloylglycine hydrolase family protein [unclassified Erysipelothrix]MBK2402555.1 choloylglycine hydrolase family protein [Erysipelothrix sp. strain 2 (EsS2-6-Brazil)]MBK2403461.1 choloylglycine hydrolase family protein [Erysipelothrix sp. strain 2 (EsS2-7-Brazil)]NBA01507.1 linear amide C-N hydrolase [Erysipelothrix rhusiopathiae]